jgi:hypothetical protein
MARVDVAFPAPGSVEDVTKPVVHADPKASLEDEAVHWQFFGDDDRVKRIRVEFKNKAHHFFPGQNPEHAYEKDYRKGAVIYGTTPDNLKPNPTRCRYSVTGLDDSGSKVAFVDPEIIVEDPEG